MRVDSPTVDEGVAGEYFVHYECTNSAGVSAAPVTRTIIVFPSGGNSPPVITVFGPAVMFLSPADAKQYSDPGSTCTDNKDGDLSQAMSSNVKIPNSLTDGKPGKYYIKYACTSQLGLNTVAIREVIVASEKELVKYTNDPRAPRLAVRGANPRYYVAQKSNVDIMEEFKELSDATCHDDVDKDLTPTIKVRLFQTTAGVTARKHVKTVHGDEPGTYVVQYSCVNKLGLKSVATRNVVITQFAVPKATATSPCGTCGVTVLKRCESMVLQGPGCAKCLEDETPKCSDEQVDAFCYAHNDDDKADSHSDNWAAFAAAVKLNDCNSTTAAALSASSAPSSAIALSKPSRAAPSLQLYGKAILKIPMDKRKEYSDSGAGCEDAKDGDL